MRYTEEELKNMSYPMNEGLCEEVLAGLEKCARSYYEQGYKNNGPVQRIEASSAYYRLPLQNSAKKAYFLEVQGAYALNIVVSKLDKQLFILVSEEDDSFKKLFDEYQKRNRATDYALKRIIRIFKHIYAEMLAAKIPEAEAISADELAATVFAVTDASLNRFDSLTEKVQYVLLQIKSENTSMEAFIAALRQYVK